MSDRDSKGQFTKGNSPKNKLEPEVKCIREAVKTEIARVTKVLTLPKSQAMQVLADKNQSLLHSIMEDAIKKKKFHIVQDFIDRTIGKATQATQVSINQIPDDVLLEMAKEALEALEGN